MRQQRFPHSLNYMLILTNYIIFTMAEYEKWILTQYVFAQKIVSLYI